MRNLKKLKPKVDEDGILLKKKALHFITAGVGCNCLIAIHKAKILEILLSKSVSEDAISRLENPICIKAALETLEKCGIVEKDDEFYKITEFGTVVAEYLGLITIFFDGYGDLVSNQRRIVHNDVKDLRSLVHHASVSEASVLISDRIVDPVVLREFKHLKFSGTICDLGCGYGTKLSKICKETKNPGLGFDSEPEVIEQARSIIDSHVSLELGDITNLQGIWEDVVILMQSFVFHDFFPENRCIKIMNSYLDNFPNLKCFFYIDIMTPSSQKNQLFPGFDYIHGLLGIPTRTYEETIRMFHQSDYLIAKEIPILDLPNTFLWILFPKRPRY